MSKIRKSSSLTSFVFVYADDTVVSVNLNVLVSSAAPPSGSGRLMGSDINMGICGCHHVEIKLLSHPAVHFKERLEQEKGRKEREWCSSCPPAPSSHSPADWNSSSSAGLLWNLRLTGGKICLYALLGHLWSQWQIGGSLGRTCRSSGGLKKGAVRRAVLTAARASRVQEPEAPQRGLTPRGSAGEEIGHHLSFALDCDHASVLQCVVVGAQNLLQVRSHLRGEEETTPRWKQADAANVNWFNRKGRTSCQGYYLACVASF